MLLGLTDRHYLMNHWSDDFFDVTIAFIDPKNVKIDILHALLLRTMITMLILSLYGGSHIGFLATENFAIGCQR